MSGGVHLKAEAYDPGVREVVLDEMLQTFGGDVGYYSGYPEATDAYMRSIISDLGKNPKNSWIQERIFRHMPAAYASGQFPRLQCYMEVCFEGVKARDSGHERLRLLNRLGAVATDDDVSLFKTRIAIKSLFLKLTNPPKNGMEAFMKSLQHLHPDTLSLSIQSTTDLPLSVIGIIESMIFPQQEYHDIPNSFNLHQFAESVRNSQIPNEPWFLRIVDIHNHIFVCRFRHFDNAFHYLWTDGNNSQPFRGDDIFRISYCNSEGQILPPPNTKNDALAAQQNSVQVEQSFIAALFGCLKSSCSWFFSKAMSLLTWLFSRKAD